MEEKQIQEFVHRVSVDEALRQELAASPDTVIMREGFSPMVARVVMKLVPHLAIDKPLESSTFSWWHD